MSVASPLQILLFRHIEDKGVAPYEEAIVRAFQGGKDAGGYLASGEDLGIQMEVFSSAPLSGVAETLGAFCHTLVIVLVDNALLNKSDNALWNWLGECWKHIGNSKGQHLMLPLVMEERMASEFGEKNAELKSLQWQLAYGLGEKEIRPATFALRLLHECRLLLVTGISSTDANFDGYLKLFISHAKIDGLPLAGALKNQIAEMGLDSFYDAKDLPAGCNWQRELEKGVGSSVIIMLRTEVYDSRHWCQQEVRWADEYATPAVLVDARTSLNYPSGTLPYDRVPTVRIPDGNLTRILFLALREGLRFLHFIRKVEQMKQSKLLPSPVVLRVFSIAPSMPALLRACQSLKTSKDPETTPRMILYPDPTLKAGNYEAAQALVATYLPGASLVTPNTLAATEGQ